MNIEQELWPLKFLHCGNRDFLPFFAPVTLTLILYMNLTCIPWRCTRCANMNFLCQAFWKLSSSRQTDRDRDRHDQNYIPCCFVGGQ